MIKKTIEYINQKQFENSLVMRHLMAPAEADIHTRILISVIWVIFLARSSAADSAAEEVPEEAVPRRVLILSML